MVPWEGEGTSATDDRQEAALAEELLHSAARILLGDLPALSWHCVHAICANEPAYASLSDATTREVYEVVEAALRVRLGDLAAEGPGARGEALGLRAVGASRARQGLALDALLHAYTVGGTVLWQRLIDTVLVHWPDRMPLMLFLSQRMWDDREYGAGVLVEVYRETLGQGAVDRAARMRRLLTDLVDGTMDPLVLGGASTALGLPRSGRFAVAVTRGRMLVRQPGLVEELLETGPGLRVLRAPGDRGDTLLVVLGSRPLSDLEDALRAHGSLRAGIGPVVESLADLGRSTRLARAALSTCTGDDEVALWQSRMPSGLVAASQGLGDRLLDRALGPVLALPPEERDSLLSTLTAWLDGEGSPRRAAELLGCHRNTVLNRLRRLEQLSDRLLTRPRDVVELALGLEAYRLRG
jgi:hypothetical protein